MGDPDGIQPTRSIMFDGDFSFGGFVVILHAHVCVRLEDDS